MTLEEILESLEQDVENSLHFEIDTEEARTLLEYIRGLESAANDPRDAP